jgi:hypothetical protein
MLCAPARRGRRRPGRHAQGPAGVAAGRRAAGSVPWEQAGASGGALSTQGPRGPRTARSARAVTGAGRVGSRMICRAAGRSMPAVPGARACSPAGQPKSRPAVLGGEPAGHEGVQAARRGRRRRRPRPVPDERLRLLSCHGRGRPVLVVADVRVPGLLAGRRPCRELTRHLAGSWRRICGKIVWEAAFAQVKGMSADICKTVGLAYAGSNPTPATTQNRSSELVPASFPSLSRE